MTLGEATRGKTILTTLFLFKFDPYRFGNYKLLVLLVKW